MQTIKVCFLTLGRRLQVLIFLFHAKWKFLFLIEINLNKFGRELSEERPPRVLPVAVADLTNNPEDSVIRLIFQCANQLSK
jgi:hypothetical protein